MQVLASKLLDHNQRVDSNEDQCGSMISKGSLYHLTGRSSATALGARLRKVEDTLIKIDIDAQRQRAVGWSALLDDRPEKHVEFIASGCGQTEQVTIQLRLHKTPKENTLARATSTYHRLHRACPAETRARGHAQRSTRE